MTPGESQALFLGMSLSEMVPIIVAGLGQELPEGWTDRLAAKLVAVLSQEVAPIPGAEAVLCATAALGLPWRVASNSSPEEMAAKFGRLGMTDLVAGRTHSAREVTLPKPAPDVFLAAAAAEGVPPECCVVVEDSPIGASGAAAAGMICLGYAPHGDGAGLRAAGALLVRNLAELPPLFARAMRRAA
jgi:HAD superfamily hydrolase (TIGR01509 family)